MSRIISICNQKGGVGKTTSIVNLGSYLASLGKKVLVIDFDPQGSASSSLGVNPRDITEHIYHGILGQAPLERIIKNTAVDNLHLIPSNQHLSGVLVELVNEPNREFFLRKLIDQARDAYDYILIDLPPSLSLLTVNGLVASDEVMIPIQCEYYSLEGLSQLLETINLINQNLGQQLKVAGAVLTMYDKRERLSREVAKEVRLHFPHYVYITEIPRAVALAEAPSFSKPIVLYKPNSEGAYAYEKLAREVINQENRSL